MIEPEFHRPQRADSLSAPREVRIEANEAERAALAQRFGLLSIDSLTALLRLTPGRRGLVELHGQIEARITQACVVTFEPVPEEISESFEMIYTSKEERGEGKEVQLDMDEPEPPEPMQEGFIDLGEAVAEHLALAINPYPRSSGASFALNEEEKAVTEDDEKKSPFAALAALKEKQRSP